MKKHSLIFLFVLQAFVVPVKSQNVNFVRAHDAGAVNRVAESFYWHQKIYFISRLNNGGPILNICDSNGVSMRTVNLPSTSSSVGNFDFRNGDLLYATQNSVYRLDSLGNVKWHSYVVSNCTSGGFVVRSKFLNNGGVIVYGCTNGTMSVLRLNPSTGVLINIVIVYMNSAHPAQVNGNAPNFWAQDALELSNSSIYFLLTRRDNFATYAENYIVKCKNDSTFTAIKGICLDNVVTNNNSSNSGRLSHLTVVSNSLIVAGADFLSPKSDLQLFKLDTNLTVSPIRYCVKAKEIGANFYSTLANVSNNNGKIYVGVTTSPNNCEASLMCFDANLNFQQWNGYDLDNNAYNYGFDCSFPDFQNPGMNMNKLFAVTSYSNNGVYSRSVIKTDAFGYNNCATALTATIVTDSLHCDSIVVSNQAGANATNTYVTTSTVQTTYNDSLACNGGVTSIREEFLLKGLNVYPNPAEDLIHVDGAFSIREIEISDCVGRQVYYERNIGAAGVINIDDLNPGVYFIRVTTTEGIIGRKILKE